MIAFVLWMLLYPVSSGASTAIYFAYIRPHMFSRPYATDLFDLVGVAADLVLWIGVGHALWRHAERRASAKPGAPRNPHGASLS